MSRMNLRMSLGVKILIGALGVIGCTEPAWAILGVWRRAAVTTAVVAGSVATTEAAASAAAANANANASREAAAAASAQQAAAASAASAAAAQQAAASAANPPRSTQQKLRDLQSLYDQKLISASDYQAAKTKILNEMAR